MKKIISVILTFVLSATLLCSYANTKTVEMLRQEKANLETEILELKKLKEDSINEIKAKKRYVLVLRVKQSHISLKISDHIKDSINDLEIPIEVSEYQYYSVDIGDELASEFRVGSAIFQGSFGSWDVTVKDKQIIEE